MLTIGITCGDVTGVGPELVVRGLLEQDDPNINWVVYGDQSILCLIQGFSELVRRLGPRLQIHSPHKCRLRLPMPKGAPEAAQAAVEWLKRGAEACLAGELDGLVTAPVNKAAINASGIPFTGQTELLAQLAGAPKPVMMLLGQDHRDRWLRVALVTTHLPLRQVPAAISFSSIKQACIRTAEACRLLGLSKVQIGVTGLNPHAGEGGLLGTEEQELILPAIKSLVESGYEVSGPLPADVAFYHALEGRYQAIVAMYHDQGLGPLKTVAFERGVNWTLGLPFIRTSPDHGTAYEIAWKGIASSSSMREAIRLAVQLAKQRQLQGWPW